MQEITTYEAFKSLLEATIEESRQNFIRFSEMPIYNNLYGQLNFIKRILIDEKRILSEDDIDRTYVGMLAVKNFEETEFEEKLKEINYAFCCYEEINYLKYTLQ